MAVAAAPTAKSLVTVRPPPTTISWGSFEFNNTGILSLLIVPKVKLFASRRVKSEPIPTNLYDVVIPLIKTSPVELIPTPVPNPARELSATPPTWKVKRGSVVPTPTFPAA